MFTLRCTRRLMSRLPHEVTEVSLRPTTALGDWYANVLFLRHAHLVLCTSERSLLSVVVPLKDPAHLHIRLREAALTLFRRLDFPVRAIAHEASAMTQLAVGRATNRSVLASMNQIVFECRRYAEGRTSLDLTSMALALTEMPILSLDCAFTPEAAAALLRAT